MGPLSIFLFFKLTQVKEAHNKFLRTVDYYLTKDRSHESDLSVVFGASPVNDVFFSEIVH